MVSVLWVLFLFLCSFQNIFVLIILRGAYGKMLNSKRFVLKRFLNQNSRTYIFSLKKNFNWVYSFSHEVSSHVNSVKKSHEQIRLEIETVNITNFIWELSLLFSDIEEVLHVYQLFFSTITMILFLLWV